jgi:hypothetical protein
MSTALVLVPGRSQQMPHELRGDSDRVAAHVAAKGQMCFALYGNTFAGLIEDHERSGGLRPKLELADPVARTAQALVLEAAAQLGFQPEDCCPS